MTNAPEFEPLAETIVPEQTGPTSVEQALPQPNAVDQLVAEHRRANRAYAAAVVAEDRETAQRYAILAEELGSELARRRHLAEKAAHQGFWHRLFRR